MSRRKRARTAGYKTLRRMEKAGLNFLYLDGLVCFTTARWNEDQNLQQEARRKLIEVIEENQRLAARIARIRGAVDPPKCCSRENGGLQSGGLPA